MIPLLKCDGRGSMDDIGVIANCVDFVKDLVVIEANVDNFIEFEANFCLEYL